jgi:hypothetical protein
MLGFGNTYGGSGRSFVAERFRLCIPQPGVGRARAFISGLEARQHGVNLLASPLWGWFGACGMIVSAGTICCLSKVSRRFHHGLRCCHDCPLLVSKISRRYLFDFSWVSRLSKDLGCTITRRRPRLMLTTIGDVNQIRSDFL